MLAHRNSRRYWVLLHAAKLGHGTDSFTSPPKEGMRRVFQMPEKSNDPRTGVPEASILSTRPLKPSESNKLSRPFPRWGPVVACRRTDGRTDRAKLRVAFGSYFAEASGSYRSTGSVFYLTTTDCHFLSVRSSY